MAGFNFKLIKNPLSKENPITVQVLGICSALAVTAKLQPAFVMAISVTVVVVLKAMGNVTRIELYLSISA